jgi:alcohol dehydrogenase
MEQQGIRKFLAPEIVTGTGVRKLAGQYLNNLHISKVLIVTDNQLRSHGWTDEIYRDLIMKNIEPVIFDHVSPNPRDYEVMEGVEIYKSNHCQGILAIGGGSPMDCAKAIGIVATNGKHILDFEGVDRIDIPCPPIICIPSTAGTSSDISQFSIIRDMQRKLKIAIISKTLVPDISLIDPEITGSMDPYLTACTGLDALTHAFEAFVSNGNSLLTDHHALNAIRLITANLPIVIESPDNYDARFNMMIGSLEAGLAFSNASLGAVHALAHSLGGLLDLPHGECNAMLLPFVVDYNFDVSAERYKMILPYFHIDPKNISAREIKKHLIQRILDMKNQVGIISSLGQRGVKGDDLKLLSQNAAIDPCLLTNPRKALADDLKAILKEAL